ncbi:MAG TPA: UpxY family transcription antiterminator [Candidatus Dormibacteraeota bacterium]|nr:UpxY family transcription antiterminator [Candidatus Dormibacteraeota bacterium]
MPYEVTGRSYGETAASGSEPITRENCPAAGEAIFSNGLHPSWFAAHTRSRHEKTVSEQLRRRRIETFLPLYFTIRRWKNGDHAVELPLFPGYTFVRIAAENRIRVLQIPGVVRLVGFNGAPVPIEEQEVESLRRALSAGIAASPHPYLTVGRRARITAGPLAGREGILVRRKGTLRVVLSVDLIQQSILVDVAADSIEPAGWRA